MNHIKVGDMGENAAAEFLQRAGYQILSRKYRSKTGEIDIIASHKGTIIFVEVKTRRSTLYGFPAESVTYTKQQKIINTALCYLHHVRKMNVSCRFDVMEILVSAEGCLKFNHIINAFGR